MPRWPAVPERLPAAATYTRCGSVGSTTIRPTAPIVWVNSVGQTAWNVAPASVLFQTPPPDAATYSVSAWRGSTTRSVIRAPTFDGPTRLHVPPPVGSALAW